MSNVPRNGLGLSALGALVGVFAAWATYAQSPVPIKIGAVLSLSGPAAVFGLPERDAIEAVVEEINRTGGVNGRKIELVLHDDKTDPAEAVRGVTQVARDGVVAIVGPSTGSGILAAGPGAGTAARPAARSGRHGVDHRQEEQLLSLGLPRRAERPGRHPQDPWRHRQGRQAQDRRVLPGRCLRQGRAGLRPGDRQGAGT